MGKDAESEKLGLSLVVVRTREGSEVPVGARVDVTAFPAIVGRSRFADIAFEETTVSREHLRLDLKAGELLLEPLTERAGVWWNGTKLEPASTHRVSLTDGTLQLGGLLLGVEALDVTEPFGEIALESGLPLMVRRSGDGVAVRLFGHDVELHRGPALALWRLARHHGEWVANDALLEELDDHYDRAMSRNINQLITYIRTAIATIIEDEGLDQQVLEVLRAFYAEREEALAEKLESLSPRGLCRYLIRNKRGFGHRLSLGDEHVRALRISERER